MTACWVSVHVEEWSPGCSNSDVLGLVGDSERQDVAWHQAGSELLLV